MRIQRLAAVVLLFAMASACGKDGDAVGPDGLAQSDINQMVEALDGLGAFGFDLSLAPGRSGTGLAAQTGRTVQVNVAVACGGGGVIHLNGQYETFFSGQQGIYEIAISQSFDGCRSTTIRGRSWTFTSSSPVTLTLRWTSNAATAITEMTGTFVGSFSWTNSEGGAGSCSADLDLGAILRPGTKHGPSTGLSGQTQGALCNRQVDLHY